jgi:hypothetical protein
VSPRSLDLRADGVVERRLCVRAHPERTQSVVSARDDRDAHIRPSFPIGEEAVGGELVAKRFAVAKDEPSATTAIVKAGERFGDMLRLPAQYRRICRRSTSQGVSREGSKPTDDRRPTPHRDVSLDETPPRDRPLE